MKLYIIRHGETDWNVVKRLQGRTDIPLNANGIELAERTASGMSTILINRVISSPLARARKTAEIVIGERKIPFLYDERIQEISFGDMEGVETSKELRDTPGNSFYSFFHTPDQYQPPKNGESLDSLCSRTADFLNELKTKHEWIYDNILISTHGATSRALLSAICKTPRNDFWSGGVPKNCSVSIAELQDDDWLLCEKDHIYY